MEDKQLCQEGSLEQMKRVFEKKIHIVEEGLKFLDVLQHSVEGKYTLKEIRDEIIFLSGICKAIQEKTRIEKERLEALKKQRERLHAVSDRLTHALYYMPASQPKVVVEDVRDVRDDTIKPQEQTKPTLVTNDKENVKPKKGIARVNLLQEEDLKRIPKHVKSHLTLDQINNGIQEVNHVLEMKYEFLKRPRRTLTHAEEKKRGHYFQMGKDLKGTSYEIFFMDSDIQEYTRVLKTKRKTKETVFLILRHLEKMKEIRKGKPPRYCILAG